MHNIPIREQCQKHTQSLKAALAVVDSQFAQFDLPQLSANPSFGELTVFASQNPQLKSPQSLFVSVRCIKRQFKTAYVTRYQGLQGLKTEATQFKAIADYIDCGDTLPDDLTLQLKQAAQTLRHAVKARLIESPAQELRRNSNAAVAVVDDALGELERIAGAAKIATSKKTAQLYQQAADCELIAVNHRRLFKSVANKSAVLSESYLKRQRALRNTRPVKTKRAAL